MAVVLVGFASWKQADESWLLWLALFVVCSEGVEVRALAMTVLSVTSLLLVVTVSCAASGTIENTVFSREGEVRYGMGFTHPNTFGLYLALVCMAFSVARFGKNPLPDMALIAFAVALNLILAKSRSSALLSILQAVLLVVFYVARGKRARRTVALLCVAIVVGVIFLSLFLMVFYDPSVRFEASLDEALSGRLSLVHSYYGMQPLTLFGSDFSQSPPIYWEDGVPAAFVVDNAYCHLILRYGLVPTLLFLVGLFALLARLVREDRADALLFGLTLMAVYGFGETLGIRVECNFFLVAMGSELLFGSTGLERQRRSRPVSGRARACGRAGAR